MTADGSASFNLKVFFNSGPIRSLVAGGAFLIAAIAVGTTIMVGNFRERALSSNERELENTVLLLARHFDQQLDDFTAVLKDIAAQIHSDGITPEIFGGQLATLEWHEVLRSKVGAYSDISGINVFDTNGTLINSSEVWPVPDVTIADRAFFTTFKSGVATTPILVELVRSRFAGGWATVVAHHVIGPKGEFLGVVTRAISPAAFEKYFASVVLGEGAAISMRHRDGTLLARYPHIERMIGSHIRASPIDRPAADRIGLRVEKFSDCDRREHNCRRGAGRLAGTNQISYRRRRTPDAGDNDDAVPRRSQIVAATSRGKTAPGHRHQQHDARPAAV
jgi:hypothetical protein